MVKIKRHKRFEGVFWVDNRLATKNLVEGRKVYGEKLIKTKEGEFRLWDARRSKPAAAIYKGLRTFPLFKGARILYLGVASGTTASHFSDIIGNKGIIYGVEISHRVLRDILPVARERKNIVPILANARMPEEYGWVEEVDVVYADVAIPDMSEVLVRNAELFLKRKGWAMIAIKARSIDVTAKPRKVFEMEKKKLQKYFEIVDFVILDPYEKDHCLFVLRKRN
ncbi:MAG: fibrillarin-like rRNA/tRNA 2'-O-methyltransferase [Candidatus Aenigmarchaeota archaeon]|nr:fibrillarin-like rRNA/tRNA 2'-O-methyltransferase [Candidatus Aenigmarchaeota archaeon]